MGRRSERPTWQVREVVAEDFDALFELVNSVAAEDKWIGAQTPLDRASSLSRWASELEDPASTRLVVVDAGQILGEAHLQILGGRADLGMQVDERHRGSGVGTALMEAIVERARRNKAHKITLQVWPHNHPARRLYERFGFVDEGRLRRHYRRNTGELWDAILMGLVLDHDSPGSRFAGDE
jgi:RimJ/RimL family protein N-acetyltransferase